MIYTDTSAFEHPETGKWIAVRVDFKMHPPEPEIGIFDPLAEVIGYTHDGDPLTDDGAEVDRFVDALPDDWFRAVAQEQAQAAAEDAADHRRQMMRDDAA